MAVEPASLSQAQSVRGLPRREPFPAVEGEAHRAGDSGIVPKRSRLICRTGVFDMQSVSNASPSQELRMAAPPIARGLGCIECYRTAMDQLAARAVATSVMTSGSAPGWA